MKGWNISFLEAISRTWSTTFTDCMLTDSNPRKYSWIKTIKKLSSINLHFRPFCTWRIPTAAKWLLIWFTSRSILLPPGRPGRGSRMRSGKDLSKIFTTCSESALGPTNISSAIRIYLHRFSRNTNWQGLICNSIAIRCYFRGPSRISKVQSPISCTSLNLCRPPKRQ